MTTVNRLAILAAAMVFLAGIGACAGKKARIDPPLPPPPLEGVFNAEQQVAYDTCLKENQAVAMAWSAIESSCRARVERSFGLVPGAY